MTPTTITTSSAAIGGGVFSTPGSHFIVVNIRCSPGTRNATRRYMTIAAANSNCTDSTC
jgi:hypothetical protein